MKRSWIPLCGICFCCAVLTSFAENTQDFVFREPHQKKYRVDASDLAQAAAARSEWLRALPSDSTNHVEFGSAVVVQLKNPKRLSGLLGKLKLSRQVTDSVFILQAPDAATALREAQRLSVSPEVLTSHPVARRPATLDEAYAARPNDTYFFIQWYLEHRGASGDQVGADLNVRSAWPVSRGEGITAAVADVGVELNHPELSPRANAALHYNFYYNTTNATPASGVGKFWAHGTEVSGLLLAEQNNNLGMSGVAPNAQLASWVLFSSNGLTAAEDRLMDMYQYQSNAVSVQNHSWSRGTLRMQRQSLLEQIGVSNAITFGRNGKGVVMVRSAGDDRPNGANANDDAVTSDPRAIVVAAVRTNGLVTTYSEPGASVLVAAPSGDGTNSPSLFTTDLLGTRGANPFGYPNNLNDYVFDATGFSGTSASAPQIAGIATLMLSANTNLTYRDVQQILALSSRHFYFNDPHLMTNGAGLLVSHNVGFGIPDAGVAVRLARSWPSKAALTHVSYSQTNLSDPIPDAGLRVLISGQDVASNLLSLAGAPSQGVHPDAPTAVLPLVDLGFGTNIPAINMTNKAALMQRGVNGFEEKINNAAAAGAAFAVIYDNNSTNPMLAMGLSEFARIPAAGITQADGQALVSRLQSNMVTEAQLALTSATYNFSVTDTLICEHVGLRITANHPVRGDLRITLVSPQGTRSVMQRLNLDTEAGPTDWTYYSTHHFFESSAGQWTVAITDEFGTGVGTVELVELKLSGVQINDLDQDGLDDTWETTYFASLASGPREDPDKDGYNNAREQAMGTDPNLSLPLGLNLSRWNANYYRLSWPASRDFNYEVWSGTNVAALTLRTNFSGTFPEGEWFVTSANKEHFLRIVAQPKP